MSSLLLGRALRFGECSYIAQTVESVKTTTMMFPKAQSYQETGS